MQATPFAAEDQLLIECSRVRLTDAQARFVAGLLEEKLDWDYILEASIRHGVSPLIHHGLQQLSGFTRLEDRVPPAALDQLAQLYQTSRSRNQRLYRVVKEIFTTFQDANIEAMALKDVHLARDVYPDMGLRPMGDLDVLIHAADYDSAAKCMTEMGFRPLPSAALRYTLKYAWAHHFQRPADNVWVDLQWNVCQREWDQYGEGSFRFDIESMWRRQRRVPIDDFQMLVPSPEDMLFHLCMHAEGHSYCELILFSEIVELLGRYRDNLDWQYFVDITRRHQAESSVYYALLLVRKLYDVALPEFLLQKIEPRYFQADLFAPLFEHLTRLHLSLDDIVLAGRPPQATVRELETEVRRTASAAMQAFKLVDHIAATFLDSTGTVMILGGSASEKIFPDPALRSLEPIQILVLDRELPQLRDGLKQVGFAPAAAGPPGRLVLQSHHISQDPLLNGESPRLTFVAQVMASHDWEESLEPTTTTSRKQIALKSLKANRTQADRRPVCVKIQIHALTPEQLLLCLSARAGSTAGHRLFAVCSLLEFFRQFRGTIDWELFAKEAEARDLENTVGDALLIASQFVTAETIPETALALLSSSLAPPRILQWARYGPEALVQYTSLKRAYYYLLILLSIVGFPAKARYVLASLIGDRTHGPVLPSVLLELLGNAWSGFRGNRQSTEDFAYWTEPERALEHQPAGHFSTCTSPDAPAHMNQPT